MTRLTLFEGEVSRRSVDGDVGFLLEIADDSEMRAPFKNCLGLRDLIGSFDTARVAAHELARKLLADEPYLRGLRQLNILEETVIGELQHALHTIHLHDVLLARGYDEVVFSGSSRFADGLARLNLLRGTGPVLRSRNVRSLTTSSRIKRSFNRLYKSKFSLDSIRQEFQQALETIDPYGRRQILAKPASGWREREIWFYTTAYTFTNAGLLYEPFFPQPFRYLVDNALTGGKPLKERNREWIDANAFSDPAFVPSEEELGAARSLITAHVKDVPLSTQSALVRDLFLSSTFFANVFLNRHLPKGLQLTSTLDFWVETVKPSAVIAGNTVFEAYALEAARKRGIPTAVLQHGLFIDYCQFLDPPADHYIVRGQFWKDFLAPEVQAKAIVLNPPQPVNRNSAKSDRRKSIVFIGQPFVLPFWHEAELADLLTALIETAAEANAELCVRVHPMEQVASYKSSVSQLMRKLRKNVSVTYSQGAGLDEVLSGAAVAVTFFSTVFQDCLRHNVPIISLDWHDFASKAQMAEQGAFTFAKTLAHMKELVLDGVTGRLSGSATVIAPFLDETSEETLRSTIRNLLSASEKQDAAS